MTLKTPEQIAAMEAQFIYAAAHECHVTDVGADDPGLAETERAVRNLIEADRAQRSHVVTIQEEGYDRHAEARAILADWDRASIPNDRGLHNAGGFAMHNCVSIREAFRALLEPPAVEETPYEVASKIGRAITDDLVTGGLSPRGIADIAALAGYNASIQAAWESWVPENAPGVRVATRDEYTAVCDVIDAVKTDDRSEDTDLYAGRILDALGVHL
ncbi:hypothetical protein [Microbacterium sp. 4NA327F11]|uniref:hypothetical protein n=1 Tax=Microbacterium sp. 4NA327F11 TaxID=2502229 RepID=UPI0010F9FB2E|nr:hypothetical protein [Microbacterium sp. 4NA327F11]